MPTLPYLTLPSLNVCIYMSSIEIECLLPSPLLNTRLGGGIPQICSKASANTADEETYVGLCGAVTHIHTCIRLFESIIFGCINIIYTCIYTYICMYGSIILELHTLSVCIYEKEGLLMYVLANIDGMFVRWQCSNGSSSIPPHHSGGLRQQR